MIRQKALTPLKGKEIPARITTFDIETEGWTKPYALGYYNGSGSDDGVTIYEGENCVDEFLEAFLTKEHRGETCYAHNGGRFDVLFFLDQFRKLKWRRRGFSVETQDINGSFAQVRVKKDKHVWTFRDSVHLIRDKLENITKTFDVKHKKLSGTVDFDAITRDGWRAHIDKIRPYLHHDVMGLAEALVVFQDLLLEKFGTGLRNVITTAMLAMRVYRRNYLKDDIPTYEHVERDIRESYFGGRVEIFKTKARDLHYYDVNSLYPSVMLKPMPVGRPVKDFVMTIDDFGILHARITAPAGLRLPLLPRREKGKLMFTNGTWEGWYCSPELQKARDLGYKIEVDYGYHFEKRVLFKDYVHDFYELKKNSPRGSPMNMTAKLLMNSLYGKFGQHRERVGQKFDARNPDKPLEAEVSYSESAHILPAIASFVTSYARLSLYDHMVAADRDGGLAYVDTDSVITTSTMPTGDLLGQLKDEHPEGIVAGVFVLPKLYALVMADGAEEVRSKGFPQGTFNYAQLERELGKRDGFETRLIDGVSFVDATPLSHTRTKLLSPMESVRRHGSFVNMGELRRSIKSTYDKRIIDEDGNTRPRTIVGDGINEAAEAQN